MYIAIYGDIDYNNIKIKKTETEREIKMKKYNLSNIMKRAWDIKKSDTRNIFAECCTGTFRRSSMAH